LHEALAERIVEVEISNRNVRVAALHKRWDRLSKAFDELLDQRGADMADIPGGATGLLCKDYKGKEARSAGDQDRYRSAPWRRSAPGVIPRLRLFGRRTRDAAAIVLKVVIKCSEKNCSTRSRRTSPVCNQMSFRISYLSAPKGSPGVRESGEQSEHFLACRGRWLARIPFPPEAREVALGKAWCISSKAVSS
jgi:hypothetical protein